MNTVQTVDTTDTFTRYDYETEKEAQEAFMWIKQSLATTGGWVARYIDNDEVGFYNNYPDEKEQLPDDQGGLWGLEEQ